MILSELIKSVNALDVAGDEQVEIKGITYDSRKVKPGWLFVAIPGANADGAAYISDALSNGAAAIVSEHQAALSAEDAIAELGRQKAT